MAPVTAYLYVTLRCNARCVFCDIWKRQKEAAQDMPVELGTALLSDLRRLGVRHVDFTGGEPLMYKPLPELLRHARNLGMFTSVTSNGLLYQQRATELSGLLYSLGFSLNGFNADMHNEAHGVPSFQKTIASIRLARDLNEPVHAHFTASDDNIDALDGTAELASSLGAPLVVFPEFSYFGNRPLTQFHLDKLLRMARSPMVCVNTASVRFLKDGGNNTDNPVCSAGRSALAIAPDGSLMLPCFHKKHHQIQTHGDLYSTYLSDEVQRLLGMSGRCSFCKGCSNWCYINPSFILKVSKYTLPHIAAAVKRMRVVQGDGSLRSTGRAVWRQAVASLGYSAGRSSR